MKLIDLTWTIHNWMPVYPWDPEAEIDIIQTVEKDSWELRRLKINSHDWTHVNVPSHSKLWWKNLNDYNLEDFIWESVLFETIDDIKPWIGVIFSDIDINMDLARIIVDKKPKFVWLSSKFEFDIEVERYLLENDIISFERLEDTQKLSKRFIFHWVPLKIKSWDWSPVRAYAICK